MRKNNKLFLGLALMLLVFGLIGYTYVTSKNMPPVTPLSQQPAGPIAETVHYSKAGFDKKTVTIRKNTAVRFVNDSKVSLRVASDPHPYHTDLPKFDSIRYIIDSAKSGDEYVYTFDKTGTWKYHNHEAASHMAAVVVTE